MGQKVHPIGLRIGIVKDWRSKWYADRDYAQLLYEDVSIRKAIRSKYVGAGISLIEIGRQAKEVTVDVHAARPGIVIGRGGQQVDELRQRLEKLVGKKVQINICEIRQPSLDATLVAQEIAEQIQRRVPYRRIMKRTIGRTMEAGAQGIKITCSGRLGGGEIARTVTMREGRVPLHTLRADIDYGVTEAKTLLGRIGIKVWIYKGDILPELKDREEETEAAEEVVSEEKNELSNEQEKDKKELRKTNGVEDEAVGIEEQVDDVTTEESKATEST
ncbi:MAG: 30S ribosomal protein S3 [Chloroflexota bacterium]|nr:30S ribosomal protein S3 [Chloroflexota bacterium]